MTDGLPVLLARRLTDRHRMTLDALLAAVLAATSVPVASRDLHLSGPHGQGIIVVSYLAVGAACLALPARRRYPKAGLGLAVAAEFVLIGLGIRLPAQLAAGFAMYSLAATSAWTLPAWVVVAAIGPMMAACLAAWNGQAVYAAVLASGSVLESVSKVIATR